MMKPMGSVLPLVLMTMCLLAENVVADQICTLSPGVYARRQTLEQQYLERVGDNYLLHKSAADRIKMQLRQIDQRYQLLFSILCKAAGDGDSDQVASCCRQVGHDQAADEVCSLSYYLATERADSESFIASFPGTPEQIAVLWNLEDITYGPKGSMVTDCGPSGLVDLYVDELFHLVTLGNRQALLKFVNLSHYAEGVFAEGLADRMKRLFVEKPRLVLKDWSVIRGFSHIEEISAEFADSEQATAERNFDNLCVTSSEACIEIKRAVGSARN